MDASTAFAALPQGLRDPLIEEYRQIVSNFAERRWGPSELSGGRFCEIVYTILDGFGAGAYASKPSKPNDFVSACRKLEANKAVPRSFQILIPRLLPALYEIRNNRGVGHVGGDVDPNHMDATAVVSICNWVMAELVRVLHALSIEEAQQLVDSLAERQTPLVWQKGDVRRVLDTSLRLRDQILVLLGSCSQSPSVVDIREWTEAKNLPHFKKTLRELHTARLVNLSPDGTRLEILPPGSDHVAKIVASREAKLT